MLPLPPPPEAPEAPEAPEVFQDVVDLILPHKPTDERSESVGSPPPETNSREQDCQACVSQCPVGTTALRINDAGLIEVHEKGCTGCGVCEWVCPTTPAAIVIKPPPEVSQEVAHSIEKKHKPADEAPASGGESAG